uniref:Uncharacterized protein n=1 Tax=Arundo donax TaxID=35708 RepID=A0A0A8YAR0_ARUDO
MNTQHRLPLWGPFEEGGVQISS